MRWQIAASEAALNMALHCTVLHCTPLHCTALAATLPNHPGGDARQPAIVNRVMLIVCSFSPSLWLVAPPHTVLCRQSQREVCSGLVLTTVNPAHLVSG